MLLANPVDEAHQLDARTHERLWRMRRRSGLVGRQRQDVTPVLLGEFALFTAGASVEVNLNLVVANAAIAGRSANASSREACDATKELSSWAT